MNGGSVSVVFPDAVRPSKITSLTPARNLTLSQAAKVVLTSDDDARIVFVDFIEGFF